MNISHSGIDFRYGEMTPHIYDSLKICFFVQSYSRPQMKKSILGSRVFQVEVA